jgi:hypothetical protein
MPENLPVTVQRFDFATLEWTAVAVAVPDQPARRTRGRRVRKPGQVARRGVPRDMTGVSEGSPIASWWEDTAFAPGTPLADMRSYNKPATMRTSRAPTVAFAADTAMATSAHRRDL